MVHLEFAVERGLSRELKSLLLQPRHRKDFKNMKELVCVNRDLFWDISGSSLTMSRITLYVKLGEGNSCDFLGNILYRQIMATTCILKRRYWTKRRSCVLWAKILCLTKISVSFSSFIPLPPLILLPFNWLAKQKIYYSISLGLKSQNLVSWSKCPLAVELGYSFFFNFWLIWKAPGRTSTKFCHLCFHLTSTEMMCSLVILKSIFWAEPLPAPEV